MAPLSQTSTVVYFGLNGPEFAAPDDRAFELVMATGRGDIAHAGLAEVLRA